MDLELRPQVLEMPVLHPRRCLGRSNLPGWSCDRRTDFPHPGDSTFYPCHLLIVLSMQRRTDEFEQLDRRLCQTRLRTLAIIV